MSTKTTSIVFSSLLCLAMLTGASEGAGRYGSARRIGEQTVIVVPARYTIIKLAFDVARIRPVTLVSYEGDALSKSPAMFIWNTGISEWVSTSLEAYSSAAVLDVEASRVVLLGSDADLPAVLIRGSAWSSEVVQIPTTSIVELVNGLDDIFKFSAGEWRYLAREYKLTLKDLNAERRRYGRYGRPGARLSRPARQSGDVPSRLSEEVPMPVSDDDLPVPDIDEADEVKGATDFEGDDANAVPELDELGLGGDDMDDTAEPAPEDK